MNLHSTIIRLLFFRITREEILKFDNRHLFAGIIGTWIVGIGRYWDNDRAVLLQHLGIGSLIYIFVLSAFLWLIVLPLRPPNWRYFTVLTFVSLTSFPAIFYAIPVELFFSIEVANTINGWFLGIVAFWRLSLLFRFFWIFTDFTLGRVITVTLLPLSMIITLLAALNLEKVTFGAMGGFANETANEGAYAVLLFLTALSWLLFIPLLLSYIGFVIVSYVRNRNNVPD